MSLHSSPPSAILSCSRFLLRRQQTNANKLPSTAAEALFELLGNAKERVEESCNALVNVCLLLTALCELFELKPDDNAAWKE